MNELLIVEFFTLIVSLFRLLPISSLFFSIKLKRSDEAIVVYQYKLNCAVGNLGNR
jgi:hypothetical protein